MIGSAIAGLILFGFVLSLTAKRPTTQSPQKNDSEPSMTEIACSKYWDPSPCICYKIKREIDGKLLLCENITSTSALKKIFQRSKKRLDIEVFALVDSRVKSIPTGIFGKVIFHEVHLEHTDVEVIEPGAFEGMEGTLSRLTFVGNKIKKINFTSQAKKLKNFIAFRELFEEISDHAFANKAYLNMFWLIQCPLKIIGDYAFANTNRLTRLKISANKAAISRIGEYAFHRPNCQTADLFQFSATQITDDVFSSTTFAEANVFALRLERNNLTTLREDIFSPLVKPKSERHYVRTIRNPIKCDSSLKWIVANETVRNLFRGDWCIKDRHRISLRRLKESDL